MLGTGILKGLKVTAQNFLGSFHDPARYTTTEYPEVPAKLPENYRSFPFLVAETEDDPMGTMRCVACLTCEKECPAQCIYIEKSKDKKPDAKGRLQFYPAVFDIDTSVCMSCQICVEVCPFDSIKMDKVFEVAATERFETLLLDKHKLTKANVYYHEIRPTEAAAVDQHLLSIGMATGPSTRNPAVPYVHPKAVPPAPARTAPSAAPTAAPAPAPAPAAVPEAKAPPTPPTP